MESIIFSSSIKIDLRGFLSRQKYSRLGLIMDSNTFRDCYPLILDGLPDHDYYVFEAGEVNKNLTTCTKIWQWMTDLGLDRKALIINLGGGVTGDMGGFCASTYKRGISFINVPTTLLSQVDASVGGKLGIDFNGYKNHIGVFTEPLAVLISEEFLKTLPIEELRSGYAEVIKHGLIQHANYYSSLLIRGWENQDWKSIIEKSVSIKKEVVSKDPKEAGLRKILNFGHTIGHAFESFYLDTDRHLLHGEAIAIGMITEAYLSELKTGLSKDDVKLISDALIQIYGKFDFPEKDVKEIISLCSQDKKNEADRINFSLLSAIGKCEYNIPVALEEIAASITFYKSL